MSWCSKRSGFRRAAVVASLVAAQGAVAGVAAARGGAGEAVRMEGVFPAEPGERARDLSGIACRPPGGADGLPCLLVNDESTFAQMATFRGGRLIAGPVVPLVGPEPPTPGAAAGSAPADHACPGGEAKFKEFDGEGVAWSPGPSGGGRYFVTGSHACGRENRKFRASTHLLARIDVDASGEHRPAALSWRLGPALANAERVGAHYDRELSEGEQGLDVEAVAASGDRLFFGLRAPSLGAFAHVVSADAADLFAADGRPDPVPTRVARLRLGEHVGIRDMAALPDGRLLLLTGPSQKQRTGVRSGISVTRPSDAGVWPVQPLLEDLRPVAGNGEAKAEGLAVLGVSGDTARVLVLFEDPANGGAQVHDLPLR